MDLVTAVALGAAGGALVETITVFGLTNDWQEARRRKRAGSRAKVPGLAAFVDLPARAAVAVTRLALGAFAGAIFHEQVVGVMAAVAVGASAPAVLQQLGSAQSVRDAVQGKVGEGGPAVPGEPAPAGEPEASR